MNGDAKSEWVWPIRNGPHDAEMTAEFSVGVIDNNVSSSHDSVDYGNTVNGMQNGDINGLDFNSKLMSTRSDTDNVIKDLTDGRYAATSKLAIHKKALPNLSCEIQPNSGVITDLPVIKETTSNYMTPPSSPMLTALRDAVSSLNRFEDFEIIEKIGEGFYAKVYKVNCE